MVKKYKGYYNSAIGWIEVTAAEEAIERIDFYESDNPKKQEVTPLLDECLKQLDEYFQGKRQQFNLPLSAYGSPFQQKVWHTLTRIPYGETASYQQIAALSGNVKAVRAVGGANNRNPLAIVVPCHRVIGKNGQLTGYAAGLWRKEWLLKFEKENLKYSG